MHVDSTLNLIWALLGFAGLAVAACSEFRHRLTRSPEKHFLNLVGTALIVTALFPYISATDNLLQIEHVSSHSGAPERTSHDRQQTNNLLRLYDVIDTSLVSARCAFTLTFTFIANVVARTVQQAECGRPQPAGRSPPVPLPA